jgi:hypothetical protein
MVVLITIFTAIALFGGFQIFYDIKEKKRERERHISYIKERITDEFDPLIEYPTNEIINSLERYLEKLIKMADLKKDLKPYDEFCVGCLKSHGCYHDRYKIIIDKNLVPKFAPDTHYVSDESDDKDYELEACMDADELRKFIDKCKMSLMNNEIEAHRKKIVESKVK